MIRQGLVFSWREEETVGPVVNQVGDATHLTADGG